MSSKISWTASLDQSPLTQSPFRQPGAPWMSAVALPDGGISPLFSDPSTRKDQSIAVEGFGVS